MKGIHEIEEKLAEAINVSNRIAPWEPEEKAAAGGAVAALAWVLGLTDNLDFNNEGD